MGVFKQFSLAWQECQRIGYFISYIFCNAHSLPAQELNFPCLETPVQDKTMTSSWCSKEDSPCNKWLEATWQHFAYFLLIAYKIFFPVRKCCKWEPAIKYRDLSLWLVLSCKLSTDRIGPLCSWEKFSVITSWPAVTLGKLSLVLRPKKQNFSSIIRKVSFVEILHLFLEEFKMPFFGFFFNGSSFATGSKQFENYKKSFYKRALLQESLLAGKSLVCLYDQFWMTDLHQN